MKIFLTGGTGALGSRVTPLLVAAGHDVTAVSRSQRSDSALNAAGAAPVRIDLFDAAAVRRAVAGHDCVINLATRIPTGADAVRTKAWADNDRLRREASRNLAAAAIAAGAGRFVQESLAFAYRDGGAEWLDESAPLDPASVQRTILDAEAAAARITDAGGAGVVLRFGAFYGRGAAHTEAEVALARRGYSGRVGRPDAYTTVIHLDDAAAAVVAALDVPAGVYNVVDDRPLTRRQHAAALAAAVGVPALRLPPAFLARLGKLQAVGRSQRVSNARLREVSGWRPRFPSAAEGWAEIVQGSGLRGGDSSPRKGAAPTRR